MFFYLLLAFIGMPILEFYILFQIAGMLGFTETLGIVVLTGVIGAILAKTQGLMVMQNIQRDLAEGKMPAPRLIDGVMILVAGVLLITPGLITDGLGFLLLFPPARAFIRAWLRYKFEQKLRNGSVNVTTWRW